MSDELPSYEQVKQHLTDQEWDAGFALFLARYYSRIQFYIPQSKMAMLRPGLSTGDIASEVCTELWRLLREKKIELRSEPEFLGLLRLMTVQRVLDLRVTPRGTADDEQLDQVATARGLSTELHEREVQELGEALWQRVKSQLNADEFYALRRHLFEDAEWAEIARELSSPRGKQWTADNLRITLRRRCAELATLFPEFRRLVLPD